MKQLEILKQHKNKVIIIAIAVVAVLSLALFLRGDAQTPADGDAWSEQPSQSATDAAIEPPAAGIEKNQADEDSEAGQEAPEDPGSPPQVAQNDASDQKPASVATEQPPRNTESDSPAGQQPQATPPDADLSAFQLDLGVPGGDSPGQPIKKSSGGQSSRSVVQQRRIVLRKGPCLVQSTFAHPYAGWPFLSFERMNITVSQSSGGRTLSTLLADSHTGDWGSGTITVSAKEYCNDNIRHRHLVNGATSCADLSPGHWTNVPFEDVQLGEHGGWCYRDIPRSSWGG
ncbi:hypothetical protein F4X86_02895 [Candidatus Saccharibacteria bacterium]|nr:hypothetical protein [Candidatus Saccharibacteria bacterium]